MKTPPQHRGPPGIATPKSRPQHRKPVGKSVVEKLPQAEDLTHLVAIGSSAGGIDALQAVVAAFDAAFPAPVVIAQHLDPNHTSHLGDILHRRTGMKVETVAGPTVLQAGVIYVVPANKHVAIEDRSVWLPDGDKYLSKPSIDLLFETAAESFGEQLIAVVLTGTGSDGTAGARVVKERGGTVIIQNPDTASFGAMPRSVAPTTVDVVAELADIGPLLNGLVAQPGPHAAVSDHTLERLLDKVRVQSGINFASYKQPTIQRRLQLRMAATNKHSLGEYSAYAEHTPAEYRRLVSSFLIKVTEFFRDPDLCTFLRERILPDLISAAKDSHELRFWSAGCATGEEAYTLAMLVCEVLGDDLAQFTVRIFATDLDPDAVEFARHGIYPETALGQLPEHMAERYFSPVTGGFELTKRVRALVVFGQHDLGQRAPFPRIDLALCRNVLIYFVPEMQKRALELFAYSLRDHGYMVLGNAETPALVPGLFTPMHRSLKVFQRSGAQRVSLSRSGALGVHHTIGRARAETTLAAGPDPAQPPAATTVESTWPVGVVVVNRRYAIESINGRARELLGIRTDAPGEDLLHLLDSRLSTPLRACIDAVLHGEQTSRSNGLAVHHDALNETWYLTVACSPRCGTGEEHAVTGAVLIVDDCSDVVARRVALEAALARSTHECDRVVEERDRLAQAREEATALALQERDRLTHTHDAVIARKDAQLTAAVGGNRELLAVNAQLSGVIAGLRGTNDRLTTGSEEVQAASEEIETLNEEFQATNEELETLNEELQATIEELNTTNDDLSARGVEMQRLSDESANERERLRQILDTLPSGVIIYDAESRISVMNQSAQTLVGANLLGKLRANVDVRVQRPDGTLIPWPEIPSVQTLPAGESTLAVPLLVRNTVTGDDLAVLSSSAPLRDVTGASIGTVSVFQDISVIRDLEEQRDHMLATVTHDLRNPLTSIAGMSQLLQVRVGQIDEPLRERFAHCLQMIEKAAGRMAVQIGELLEYAQARTSRQVSLDLEAIDVIALLQQTLDEHQGSTERHTLTLQSDAETLVALVDPRRLERAIANLLVNAIKYSPEGGAILVSVARTTDSNGEWLHIAVADHGLGIPSSDLPHVGEQYFRASNVAVTIPGTGIGLSNVHHMVELYGGTVGVESTEGEGTTVTVRLPLLQATHKPAARVR